MIIKNNISAKKDTKLCIFDIDNTLVRYNTLRKLIDKALNFYGITPQEEYYGRQGLGVKLILDRAINERCFNFENLCLSWAEQLSFLQSYGVKVEDFARKMIDLEVEFAELLPNAIEMLSSLSKEDQMRLICSTNWFKRAQQRKLHMFNMAHFFSEIYTCEDRLAKPNRAHFEGILEDEGYNPEQAVMIGDSSTDIPPKTTNIDSILLDSNGNKQNLYDQASAVVTDLSDIPKILVRSKKLG